MLIFWLWVSLMVAVALALLVPPLLGRGGAGDGPVADFGVTPENRVRDLFPLYRCPMSDGISCSRGARTLLTTKKTLSDRIWENGSLALIAARW